MAGTSSEIFLEKICGKKDVITPITPIESKTHTPRNYERPCVGSHCTLKNLFKKFPPRRFRDYSIVANTRNPWDRCVSSYNMKVYLEEVKLKSFPEWIKERSSFLFNVVPPLAPHIYTVNNWIRFENLENDIFKFCESKKIDCKKLKLPHAKKYNKNRKHYSEYYDDESREIVEKVYKRDIDFFNYKF